MTVQSIERKAKKEMEKAEAIFRQNNEQAICTAYELGKAGFAAGKKAPAQCAECLALIPRGAQVGDGSSAIYTAWSRGWNFAHYESIKDELARILAN